MLADEDPSNLNVFTLRRLVAWITKRTTGGFSIEVSDSLCLLLSVLYLLDSIYFFNCDYFKAQNDTSGAILFFDQYGGQKNTLINIRNSKSTFLIKMINSYKGYQRIISNEIETGLLTQIQRGIVNY